jgi:CRISPR system Cascade subunit CasD
MATKAFQKIYTKITQITKATCSLHSSNVGNDELATVNGKLAQVVKIMGVRVDREGVVLRDYQTATGILNAAGKVDMNRTVVSPRYYLSDAAFLVGFEGEATLLARIHQALRHPHWPLSLGRKGCLPSPPVYLPDGLHESDLLTALRNYPELSKGAGRQVRRLLLEASEGAVRLDQPIAPFAERRFGPRFVTTQPLDPQEAPCS